MKLARVRTKGKTIPVIIDSDNIPHNLEGIIDDVSGDSLSSDVLNKLQNIDMALLPLVAEPYEYGPCVGGSPQIICVGLNYANHAKESGMEIPKEPILFMKSPSSICGPNDNVILPKNSKKVDWEVELAIIIGSRCSYVSEKDASSYIAGYSILNDVSERAFQIEGTGQWVKGKSADTFAPIGPWLVTPEEVGDVQRLNLWLDVNSERLQFGNTEDMIFGVNYLVSYISQYMTLRPGDVISTGTPFGVGLGLSPPRYLQSGDKMTLGIDKLGVQVQYVKSWTPKL